MAKINKTSDYEIQVVSGDSEYCDNCPICKLVNKAERVKGPLNETDLKKAFAEANLLN